MVSRRDERFAAMAAEEAAKSLLSNWRIGCVAVVNGKVVARGHNHERVRFKKWQNDQTYTCHAEADVIYKLMKQFPLQHKVV